MSGLNGDTPLGYVVQIRSETDSKKIRKMTKKEKEIRNEWNQFKLKNKKQQKIELKKEDISKVFSSIFR